MEKEEKNKSKTNEPEFVFQWGKRLRCVRVKTPSKSNPGFRQKITSKILTDPTFSPINTTTTTRGAEGSSGNGKSPERYYSTRGSEERENGKSNMVEKSSEGQENGKGNLVWPKLYISLSSKEKEEDFLAMKGCKLPQRPKKRAKYIQRTLLFVSPGAWLTDMCQERYEVREKKTPKKRPTGLKAMGAVNSDTE